MREHELHRHNKSFCSLVQKDFFYCFFSLFNIAKDGFSRITYCKEVLTLISINKLKKIFTLEDKAITAVDSISLDIAEGEIFGVIGYSGAGKSTFVRLLNRLEEPTDGTVFIDGKEITKLKGKQLRDARQDIGMIFQHFNLLWSRTVEENISFPLEIAGVPKAERKERVQELIDLVGLSGREKAYPSQLSGGQKQRVGIARALANKPKLLLCDEATSALDPETTNSILDLLVDINKKFGLTIILITHEMHVIKKVCHRVAVMEDGVIVEQGTVEDIFTNPQQEITKKFITQVEESVEEGVQVNLHFGSNDLDVGIITEIAERFAVQLHILEGKVSQVEQGVAGTFTIKLNGEDEEVENAISYLESSSVKVEVIRQ